MDGFPLKNTMNLYVNDLLRTVCNLKKKREHQQSQNHSKYTTQVKKTYKINNLQSIKNFHEHLAIF